MDAPLNDTVAAKRPITVEELLTLPIGSYCSAPVSLVHDLHALSGQVLELLELALLKPEPRDTLKLAVKGAIAGTTPGRCETFIPAVNVEERSAVAEVLAGLGA